MFVGNVDLGNGTGLELVIVPLKGSEMPGLWSPDRDLLLLCVMQDGRCCKCRASDHPDTFKDNLGMPADDAERLADWLKVNLSK